MPDDVIDLSSGFVDAPPRVKLQPRPQNYDEIVNRHAARTGLDPNLVKAVIGQESSGNPRALSPKGAGGLMQLMPGTASRFGVTNVNDPEQNVRGGTDYLKFLRTRYNGDFDKTIAAYNAGEGNVDKWSKRGKSIPPFAETQAYVPAVKARYQKLTSQKLSGPKSGVDLSSGFVDEAPAPVGKGLDLSAGFVDEPTVKPKGVSDSDRERHLAMTPQEYKSLLPQDKQRVNKWTQRGVAGDSQKRAAGQTEFKPDADYQNRMRQAAGLPIAKSASSFEGVTGAAGDTRSGVGELRRADDPETSRILRVQKQVTAEQTPAEREMQRAPGTAEARLMDPHLTENEEVLRRVADEQEKDAATKVDTDWQAKNATEIQKQTALYRQDIQKAAQRGKVDSPTHSMKWLAEFGTKAGAGLVDFGASAVKAFGGIVDDEDVASASNKLADKMRIHVLAAQKAAEEEGADRNVVSKWVQDVGSGFIASAPELAAMSLGVPAPLAFAGGSGLRAYGSDKPVIPAAVHGAGTGLAFELGGEGQGLAGAARKAGTVGAVTTGLELASGKSLGEAAKTGATNALMVLPGALRSSPKGVEGERQTETQRQGVSAEKSAETTAIPGRIDRALDLEVNQGAKHFGITPTEFIDLVNDFESGAGAVKTALSPLTKYEQPSTPKVASPQTPTVENAPVPEPESAKSVSPETQPTPTETTRDLPTSNYRVPLSDHAPTMYREASPMKALELIPTSRITADQPDVYLADNPDLALGQGGNKGVMLEFDASKLQGQINKKPGWELGYRSGASEYRATYNKQGEFQDALQAVTVKPDVKMRTHERMQMDRALSELEQSGWTKTKNADGSVRYEKPATQEAQPKNVSAEEVSPIQSGATGKERERSFPKTLVASGREGGTDRTYNEFTDKESRDRASARIARDPEAAAKYVLGSNEAPESPRGKERIATGLMLADRLATEAEKSTNPVAAAAKHSQAVDLYTKLSTDLTTAGQMVQAASQAKKYSVEGAPLEVVRIAKKQGATPKATDITEVRQMAKTQADFETRLAEIQKQIEEMQAKSPAKAKAPTTPKAARPKVETLTDRLTKMESEAWARIAETKAKMEVGTLKFKNTGPIPGDIAAHLGDYAKIGAAKIAKGGLNFASWSKEMIDDLGEAIRPHLNKIFIDSHKLVTEQRLSLKEDSAVRSASKELGKRGVPVTEKSIEDLRQEKYEIQVKKRQNASDMDRKFNQLEERANRTKFDKGIEVATSLTRDSLLSLRRVFELLGGMTTKQLADFAAQAPAAAMDIAQVRGAQMFGKKIPRTTVGPSFGALRESAKGLKENALGNMGKVFTEKPSDVMPEVWKGPFEHPVANALIALMGKIYAVKEVLIRTAVNPVARYNEARVMALNDAMDGVIKRSEVQARTQDYLNGRATIEGGRNQKLAESRASQATDYETRSRNPTSEGVITKSGKAKRVKDMINDPTQLVDSLARQRTDKQVYAEPSLVSTGVEGAKRAITNINPTAGRVADAVQSIAIPFIKRPSNSIRDLLYTYTGVRVPVEAIRNSFGEDKWTPAERASFNEAVGRAGVGIGAMYALGYALGKRGILTSQTDKEHPGSFHIGSEFYSIAGVPVVGWMMTAGATHAKDGVGAVPGAMIKMISDHPLLKGMKNVSDAVQEGNNLAQGKGTQKKLAAGAVSFAGKMISRAVPAASDIAANLTDTQQRETRKGTLFEQLTRPAIARIPLARRTLPATGEKSRWSALAPFQPSIALKSRKSAFKF